MGILTTENTEHTKDILDVRFEIAGWPKEELEI
jgi:hypothetical protein